MTFKELNLSAPLLRAVQEAGYETPSPIQAAAMWQAGRWKIPPSSRRSKTR